MQIFIILMSVAVLLFVLIVWFSLKDQRTEIRGPAVTEEQSSCAGIWKATSTQSTQPTQESFYLALEQAGQQVKGTYRAGTAKTKFSATYSAPRLFFDLNESDQTVSVVTAVISKDGLVLTGNNWNQNSRHCKKWTAEKVLPLAGDRMDVVSLDKLNGLLDSIVDGGT